MRFSLIGYSNHLNKLSRNIMFKQGKLLESLAEKSWEISPGCTTTVPKAFYLPGQLDRVTGTEFSNPIAIMLGGTAQHQATKAYSLKDVWMLNGSIYKDKQVIDFYKREKLKAGMKYLPSINFRHEISDASIYDSFYGNVYFYNWLVDDLPMYSLAASEGNPVTFDMKTYSHAKEYESALEMNPVRTNAAYLKNAILFDDDWGNNAGKHERFSNIRKKLLSVFPGKKHPGTFILRHDSGITRILENELEIAETLRDKYGFTIVDSTKHSASEILSACIGAQVLIGIEGSQLSHGLMVLEPGTSVLMLQPPFRFVGSMKITADMEHINYGFVVGSATAKGFYIDFEEIERTMELFPKV